MRESSEKSVLKEQGNYLITGGMGELGQVFARYLAEHTRGTVILVGRRKADDAIGQKLAALREINAKVTYLSWASGRHHPRGGRSRGRLLHQERRKGF